MHTRKLLIINCGLILIFLAACSSANKANYGGIGRQLSNNVVIAEEEPVENTELVYDEPKISEASGISGGMDMSEGKRSTYSTKFNAKDKARSNNITIAANSINGVVLQPNEVFSYNNTVGPTIKRRGYKMARIFKNGQDGKGYGGGVCQVSSTLYNTADDFGMEIIERHPHSKEVKYVPEGRDAATSYGGVDLKFKNTMPYPVRIETSVSDGVLTVDMVSLA